MNIDSNISNPKYEIEVNKEKNDAIISFVGGVIRLRLFLCGLYRLQSMAAEGPV